VYFLCDSLLTSRSSLQKIPEKDGRDICPGNDGNGEAPIGYSVNKYALTNIGVILQWEIFFKLREAV
jgi:hypothetical protein